MEQFQDIMDWMDLHEEEFIGLWENIATRSG